jgi:hypothetical protein
LCSSKGVSERPRSQFHGYWGDASGCSDDLWTLRHYSSFGPRATTTAHRARRKTDSAKPPEKRRPKPAACGPSTAGDNQADLKFLGEPGDLFLGLSLSIVRAGHQAPLSST